MSDETVMDRAGAAEFLKSNLRTIDYLVSSKQIPYSRLGKRMVRFRKDRLLDWLESRENVEFKMPRKN